MKRRKRKRKRKKPVHDMPHIFSDLTYVKLIRNYGVNDMFGIRTLLREKSRYVSTSQSI